MSSSDEQTLDQDLEQPSQELQGGIAKVVSSLAKNGGRKTRKKLLKMSQEQSQLSSKLEREQETIEQDFSRSKSDLDRIENLMGLVSDKMRQIDDIRQDIDYHIKRHSSQEDASRAKIEIIQAEVKANNTERVMDLFQDDRELLRQRFEAKLAKKQKFKSMVDKMLSEQIATLENLLIQSEDSENTFSKDEAEFGYNETSALKEQDDYAEPSESPFSCQLGDQNRCSRSTKEESEPELDYQNYKELIRLNLVPLIGQDKFGIYEWPKESDLANMSIDQSTHLSEITFIHDSMTILGLQLKLSNGSQSPLLSHLQPSDLASAKGIKVETMRCNLEEPQTWTKVYVYRSRQNNSLLSGLRFQNNFTSINIKPSILCKSEGSYVQLDGKSHVVGVFATFSNLNFINKKFGLIMAETHS